MATFAVEQLRRHAEREERALWLVDLPRTSYDGKVVVPIDWTADQVASAINGLARQIGYNAACGRLWSPTRFGLD